MRNLTWLAFLVATFALPTIASAGDCPRCESAADCPSRGGEATFCVLHNRDVGCGTARQICCPGQSCSTFDGRPSCEAEGTCTVVGGGGGSDAGPRDGGSIDGGRSADASAPDGAVGLDAPAPDSGTRRPDMTDCSCRFVGRSTRPTAGIAIGLLAALAASLSRRTRRG